jgi:hypothetical protein
MVSIVGKVFKKPETEKPLFDNVNNETKKNENADVGADLARPNA